MLQPVLCKPDDPAKNSVREKRTAATHGVAPKKEKTTPLSVTVFLRSKPVLPKAGIAAGGTPGPMRSRTVRLFELGVEKATQKSAHKKVSAKVAVKSVKKSPPPPKTSH